MMWRMKVATVALLIVTTVARTVRSQDHCAHAGRNALIGGGVGATLIVGAILTAPQSANDRPSETRITATRSLMITWAAAWGAGIGSAIAVGGNRCFPPPRARRDAAGRCGSAIRGGALRGSAGGGLVGFLMSPVIAVFPLMLPLRPGGAPPFNLDHFMGVATATGVVLGAPIGAVRSAYECDNS